MQINYILLLFIHQCHGIVPLTEQGHDDGPRNSPRKESQQDRFYCEVDGTCTPIQTKEEISHQMKTVCEDKDENCVFWASEGECKRNPRYMHPNCALSCGKCSSGTSTFTSTEEEENEEEDTSNEACVDLHDECPKWVSFGECSLNHVYMRYACKYSCMLCINPMIETDHDRQFLERAKIFMTMDLGKAQSIVGNDASEKDNTAAVIRLMDQYVRKEMIEPNLDNITRWRCKNDHSYCAYYASKGRCNDDVVFMLNVCPLACMSCTRTKLFDRCIGKRNPLSPSAFGGEEIDLYYEKLSKDSQDTKDPVKTSTSKGLDKIVSSLKRSSLSHNIELEQILPPDFSIDDDTHNTSNHPAPWVIKLEKVVSEEDCTHLIQLGYQLGWSVATKDHTEDYFQGFPSKKDVRRDYSHTHCEKNSTLCRNDIVLSNLLDKLSNLTQIQTIFLETVEFVKLNVSDSLGVQHDFRPSDVWKPAGPRVMSMFVCLSDVKEGGALGFPSQDWLFIPPKIGQVVVWPNVLNEDPTKKDDRMVYEYLPVVEGVKYGMHLRVHLYSWLDASKRGCT